MTIKNLQVVSPSTLSLDVTVSRPVCVFHGPYAELALDLLRELIGDFTSISDPDRLDDGRFVLQSDVEVDGKSFNVCYIRNADFMGDHRIAANFVPNRTEFSKDDTVEYVEKCRSRNENHGNVAYGGVPEAPADDDRPLFVYCVDSDDTAQVLHRLARLGRQAFVAITAAELGGNTAAVQAVFAG